MDVIQRKYFERDFSNIFSFTNYEMNIDNIKDIINSYNFTSKISIQNSI